MRRIKDNWKRDSGELEIGGDLVEWAGKVVLYERWAQDDADQNSEETELQAEMQGMELKTRGARVQSTEYPAASSPCRSVSVVSRFQGT